MLVLTEVIPLKLPNHACKLNDTLMPLLFVGMMERHLKEAHGLFFFGWSAQCEWGPLDTAQSQMNRN